MSISILRRYTPSTCTLEIMAKESPLSRWTGRPTLQQVRFQLSFDGPHLPSDRHVAVRGDREQLDRLCDIVEEYVQDLLRQSPAQFDTLLSLTSTEPRAFSLAETHRSQNGLLGDRSLNGVSQPAGMALQPVGALKHTLSLGELTNSESGLSVTLSTLELFDLANALDEYQADTLSLPAFERARQHYFSNNWLRVAAVLLLTVGVTATVTQFLTNSPTTNLQTADSLDNSDEQFERDDIARSTSDDPASDDTLSESAEVNLGLEQTPSGEAAPFSDFAQPTRSPSPNAAPPETRSSQQRQPANGGQSPGRSQQPPNSVPSIPPQLTAIPPVERSDRPSSPSPSGEIASNDTASSAAESAPLPSSATMSRQPSAPGETSSSDPQPQSRISRSAPDGLPNQATLGDPNTIPQLEEIRDYFRDRWQPPESLTRNLEYRLMLNADGSIERVVPLGPTAEDYIDRTEMPLRDEPFVSRIQDGHMPQIRLILGADGDVQAFLEYLN
ncbi:MAG TPA: DUF4335 domain-containing protein [Elainellaceae cyanobacterium]